MLKNGISLCVMIRFSPAKINVGLQITGRRNDGFHDLQSVMVPIGLCDILEIRPSARGKQGLHFSHSGIPVEVGSGKNLCEKAHEIMAKEASLPPVDIHLHKQIPVGAGLGGGSSNATNTLLGLNQLSPHPVALEKLHEMASSLGSDCPFFLHSEAMMMEGRGDLLGPASISFNGQFLVVLFPQICISTAEAYAGVAPEAPNAHLVQLISHPIGKWKDLVVNDFEKGIFQKYPVLEGLKDGLYEAGATYASLSGSGSSLYGFFPVLPELPAGLSQYVIWKGKAGSFTVKP
jgi:4-diphosphocytidyl-2-C-methyl-D-erythritol kinase